MVLGMYDITAFSCLNSLRIYEWGFLPVYGRSRDDEVKSYLQHPYKWF